MKREWWEKRSAEDAPEDIADLRPENAWAEGYNAAAQGHIDECDVRTRTWWTS